MVHYSLFIESLPERCLPSILCSFNYIIEYSDPLSFSTPGPPIHFLFQSHVSLIVGVRPPIIFVNTRNILRNMYIERLDKVG